MKRANTSASNIHRRRLCPGSAALEQGIAETDSEYSQEGTMLHELFLTVKRPESLTVDQVTALDAADFYANEFFGNVRARFNIPAGAEFFDEREIALTVRDVAGKPLFPGHADIIRTWPSFEVRAIVDAKFGIMEVPHAADNDQLASYAVARQQQSPAKAVAVAIVQPRNFGPILSQAIYLAPAIPAAAAELERIVKASLIPKAPRIPGEKQCHFCRAKTLCDEYKAGFMGIQEKGEFAVEMLDSADLEKLHIAISFANKIGPDVKAEMRARIEAGTMPGWKLQNAGERATVNDSFGLFRAICKELGGLPGASALLTAAAFDDCRSMVWEKLTTLLQSVTRLPEKKAKAMLAELSAPFVTKTPIERRIVRDKGTKDLE